MTEIKAICALIMNKKMKSVLPKQLLTWHIDELGFVLAEDRPIYEYFSMKLKK
jgi:hypothetical protein